MRKEFARLEAASAKGVEQLQARYRPYDEALNPVRDELKALGKTEAEAIKMLVDWRKALSGPQKAQAFSALARAEGIDLSQLVPRQSPGQPQAQQQNAAPDARAILQPYLDPINREVTSLKSELQRRDWERTQNDLMSFSKDKPHYERVRVAMGHLIGNGLAQGASPKEVFDDAYDRACRMDPEVFAAVQSEAEAKRQADAVAKQQEAVKRAADAEVERKRKEAEEVAKARKAGIGLRGGAPTGSASSAAKGNETVRESLDRARREVGTRI